MDKDRSGSSGLGGNGILAILLLSGGAFVLRAVPLESNRPAANEPRLERQYSVQDIDARLWQDPFGAVAQGREKVAAKQSPPPDEKHSAAVMATQIREAVSKVTEAREELESTGGGKQEVNKPHDQKPALLKKVIVLAVMLPGGPYSESVEARRRTRYAVLSALNTADYVPVDTEHLGYFVPAAPGAASYTPQAPAAGQIMVANAPVLNTSNAGKSSAINGSRQMPDSVPYEWFKQCHSCNSEKDRLPHRVLVLWLDAGPFHEEPFGKLTDMFRSLQGAIPSKDLRWQVLGPIASDGLRAMVDEVLPLIKAQKAVVNVQPQAAWSRKIPVNYPERDIAPVLFPGMDVHFYSSQATVPAKTLLDGAGERMTGLSLEQFFKEAGIKFLRTTGDDEILSKAIVDELKLRGLRNEPSPKPLPNLHADLRNIYRDMCNREAPQRPDSPHHIALVAEWDTLYGRSLRRNFRIEPEGNAGFCVHRFDYVRGIDGVLPDRGSPSGAGNAGTKEPPAAKDDSRRKDGGFIERAEGQSQFDYLRRLAEQIRVRDRLLRSSNVDGSGIRAIGVVGNDVHDKLLVMQALHKDFPNAIFFTTDIDARLLHPAELGWTRNLIVASNFGLRLNDRLQEGTPPFRNSYQSATFFAARLALDQPWHEEVVDEKQLGGWLRAPRIFEIGRTSAFDFSRPLTVAPERDGKKCGSLSVGGCAEIHPPGTPRFAQVSDAAVALAGTGLLLMLWLPARALSRPIRRGMRRYAANGSTPRARIARSFWLEIVLMAVLVVLPVSLLVRYWRDIAHWVTDEGKPISFTEGISTWPTAMILLLTLVLSVFLLFRAWGVQAHNLDEISLALRVGPTRRQLVKEQRLKDFSLTWWQKLANIFHWGAPPIFQYSTHEQDRSGLAPITRAFWRSYLVQDRASSRFIRSATVAALLVGFGAWLFHALGEPSGIPVRGEFSSWINHGLVIAAIAMMSLLVSYVGDATFFCVRLIRELRGRKAHWPDSTKTHFQRRLGQLPQPLLDHWIDLQFVARRTQCVAGLIYYPFIVLSLLLLSRSRMFDDWEMPLSLVVMAVLSAAIVFACAIALRRVSEKSRRLALQEVDEALFRAHGSADNGGPTPAQLGALRDRIAELKQGAFAPFSQQPLLKALLLPFATLGGTTLLDYMALVNL